MAADWLPVSVEGLFCLQVAEGAEHIAATTSARPAGGWLAGTPRYLFHDHTLP